jgi:hypothetical protein
MLGNYTKIVNPVTGRNVNIKSKLGKQIISNYVKNANGGGKIESLRNHKIKNKFSRVKISPIEGVGVFAIRDIRSGQVLIEDIPMKQTNGKFYTEEDLIENGVDEENIKLLKDYWCQSRTGLIFLPDEPGAYTDDNFLNHSLNNNLGRLPDNSHIALRNIKKGDELTINFNEACNGSHYILNR